MLLVLVAGAPEYLAQAPERSTAAAIEQFRRLLPAWDRLDDLWDLWIWSECLVLLFNRTKRGLHDYLGRTWVIRSSQLDRFLTEAPAPFSWRAWAHTLRTQVGQALRTP